jgi:transposase
MRAISLIEQGRKQREVARMLEVSDRSVRRWWHDYKEGGLGAIRAKPVPGRPSKLSDAQREELCGILLKGARAAGFPTELWTCPRVRRLIKDRFGLTYHVDSLPRLLRSMGFSPQKPDRRAAERDEEGIRRWVKEQWPRIKKGLSS